MTTLDLYHRTSEDAARAIVATGRFLTRENTPEAYVSTHVDGEAAGYGSAVVHVRVDEADAQLEDEFPDGELHEVGSVITAMQAAGFEARHMEDLREHYALTLRAWVANLEQNWDRAVADVGVNRARVWRLYMAGSALGFEQGRIGINQVLGLRDPDQAHFPLRPDWTADPAPPARSVVRDPHERMDVALQNTVGRDR